MAPRMTERHNAYTQTYTPLRAQFPTQSQVSHAAPVCAIPAFNRLREASHMSSPISDGVQRTPLALG